MFYRGEIRCVAPSSAINLRSEVKSMKKKRNILKKVLLICCMAGLLFSLTSYENYFEVSAASKASYKIVNKRQVKQYKDHKAEYLYQLPQLKGKSAAIKKINKSIMTDYKNTFEYKKNLFNYFEGLKKSSYTYIFYLNKCKVTYNQNGYVSFKFTSNWYAGGIGETKEYGLTYRLKDGKKMTVQDVVYGKKSSIKKNIAKAYARRISKEGYKYIMQKKYSDIDFYVKPGKKVFVCFGPYQPMGGHGCSVIVMKGKI